MKRRAARADRKPLKSRRIEGRTLKEQVEELVTRLEAVDAGGVETKKGKKK